MKETIIQTIEHSADCLKRIALSIGNRPELGHQEIYASSLLTEYLEKSGFTVKRNVLELQTAFIAEYRAEKPGPTIGFLCEYDALPEIGHACGHHLICTMGIAAASGLRSVIDRTGGTIRVYGTPAEETSGAKVPMAAAGLFDDVDAALMAHPYDKYELSGTSLAMDAWQFEFYGKAAHAAASPYEGINALDAVIQLFNSINALRQQLESHVRIHGIIHEGGKAANIIPEFAAAKFYIRSASRAHTDKIVAKVKRCAEGAALQTGCTVKYEQYEYSYDEMKSNSALSQAFTDALIGLGVSSGAFVEGKDHGSIDLGNVSLRCPAIHPYIKVVDEPHALHTVEFRDSAMQDRALDGMLLGGKALALTAYEICANPDLLQAVKEEFQRN